MGYIEKVIKADMHNVMGAGDREWITGFEEYLLDNVNMVTLINYDMREIEYQRILKLFQKKYQEEFFEMSLANKDYLEGWFDVMFSYYLECWGFD